MRSLATRERARASRGGGRSARRGRTGLDMARDGSWCAASAGVRGTAPGQTPTTRGPCARPVPTRSDQPVVASDQRAHPGWSSTCDDFSPPVLLSLRARAPSRLALHARGARCGARRGSSARRDVHDRALTRARRDASRDARRDLGPLPRRDRSRGSAPIAPGRGTPASAIARVPRRDRARLAPAAAAIPRVARRRRRPRVAPRRRPPPDASGRRVGGEGRRLGGRRRRRPGPLGGRRIGGAR